jgi:hypothetical protein
MISSPPNLPVDGLDPATTRAVWSLVQDDQNPDPAYRGRTAVVLHLILNDADQGALEALTPGVHTFGDLLKAMGADPVLGRSPATASLRELVSLHPAWWAAPKPGSSSAGTP